MENSQQHSFIPKSPVRTTKKPRGVRRVYVLTYVALIFFFGTLLATAGIFIWGMTIDQQLAVQKENLAVERGSFNQADLEYVRDLEVRMNTAFDILNRQVSVYSVLDALEKTTLSSVQLLAFELAKQDNQALQLSLSITSPDFNASLFQREVVTGNSILSGAEFSEVSFSDSESATGAAVREVKLTMTKALSALDIPYMAPTVPSAVEIDVTEQSPDDSLPLDTSEPAVTTDNN